MITFIIGNGFDLNLGMKTRYVDVYDSYIASPSKSKVIESFKKRIANDYENWSDFELGMAEFAREFSTEDDFILCVRDFKQHMVQWLTREQQEFLRKVDTNNASSEIAVEFYRVLKNFYKGSTPNVTNAISRLISVYGSTTSFISFNYTSVLDAIVKLTVQYHRNSLLDWKMPVHIHGLLSGDVVLGVDDMEQINNGFYGGKKLKRAFVKPYFNVNFDGDRVTRATEIIESSKIICTFGWSFGKTDATWVEMVKKWLLSNNDHHLIVLKNGDYDYPMCNSDERMDKEDELKDEVIGVFDLTEAEIDEVYDRIHVPVGHGMFDFEKITQHNTPQKELATVQ